LKGISLPLETVVLLILAAIILAALLGFFLGTFTPAQSEADLVQQQLDKCQEIARLRCYTDEAKTAARTNLLTATGGAKPLCRTDRPACSPTGPTGTQPVDNCIKNCCSVFCP